MIGAQCAVLPDDVTQVIAVERVILGDPTRVRQCAGSEREWHGQFLIDDFPLANVADIAGRRAHYVLTHGDEVNAGGVDHVETIVIGEPDADRRNLGREMRGVIIVVAASGRPTEEVFAEVNRG